MMNLFLNAKDYPKEKILLSFNLVSRYLSDGVSDSHIKKILKAIPNRIKYFDEQEFDIYPIVPRE